MSTYTIKEAKDQLSDLIDRALGGEGAVIERNGAAVVELKPVQQRKSRPITRADLEWLKSRRVKLRPGSESASETLRKMRDEY